MEFESNSVEETISVASDFASKLAPGDVVSLDGDLGAGKTHFVKGLAVSFGVERSAVNSPTFTLINEYKGTIPVYHFDCYRLKSEQEALEIGIEEYLYDEGVCVIEWPSRIESLLPENTIRISIKHAGDSKRIIYIPD